MRTKNHPGKKYRRQQVALKNAGAAYDAEFMRCYVPDARVRVGARGRDVRGLPKGAP